MFKFMDQIIILLDDGCPTSTNLENDHDYTKFIGVRHLGKPKAMPRELMLKVNNIIPLWSVVFV